MFKNGTLNNERYTKRARTSLPYDWAPEDLKSSNLGLTLCQGERRGEVGKLDSKTAMMRIKLPMETVLLDPGGVRWEVKASAKDPNKKS
jgi:hypothetical protein